MILSRNERRELRGIGRSDMTCAWRVAEIAYKAYRRNVKSGSKSYDYQIYAAVAAECGYSSGKVEQLVKLHMLFPENTRHDDYLLGHYTVAASLDDRFNVLEYMEFYRKEYGKLPAVSRLSYLYRKQILGEYVDLAPIQIKGHELVPVECAGPNPFDRPEYTRVSSLSGLVRSVRGMLENFAISKDGSDKLTRALELIEEVMFELV